MRGNCLNLLTIYHFWLTTKSLERTGEGLGRQHSKQVVVGEPGDRRISRTTGITRTTRTRKENQRTTGTTGTSRTRELREPENYANHENQRTGEPPETRRVCLLTLFIVVKIWCQLWGFYTEVKPYLPKLKAEANNWSLRHWQIAIFCDNRVQ